MFINTLLTNFKKIFKVNFKFLKIFYFLKFILFIDKKKQEAAAEEAEKYSKLFKYINQGIYIVHCHPQIKINF